VLDRQAALRRKEALSVLSSPPVVVPAPKEGISSPLEAGVFFDLF